jgi:hypothetical protein
VRFVLPLLVAALLGVMYYNGIVQGAERLPLEKPEFTWVRCTCPNGTELGLNNEHFIKMQMYVAGLENEYEQCSRQD